MRHLLPISKLCVSCHVLLLILLFPNALRFLVMNVSKTSSTPQACRLPPSSFELAKVGPFLLRRRKRYTYNVTAVYKNEKKKGKRGRTFAWVFYLLKLFHLDATTTHYSKSQIFVQKFKFVKTPTFSPNFFGQFSREIKVVNC